jgi:hypothetical protein
MSGGLDIVVWGFAVPNVSGVCVPRRGVGRLSFRPTSVGGVRRCLRRTLRRRLQELWETQVLAGRMLAGDIAVSTSRTCPDPELPPQPLLTGPPPGHPERMVHNAAPDAREWLLWADILDR